MHRLVEMSIRYQEVAPLITRYTIEYEIKLPEKRTLSGHTESTRSIQTCSSTESETKSVSDTDSGSQVSSIAKVVITFKA